VRPAADRPPELRFAATTITVPGIRPEEEEPMRPSPARPRPPAPSGLHSYRVPASLPPPAEIHPAPGRDGGEPLDVVVVDDHELLRTAVVWVLDADAGFRVVGQAASAVEAIEVVRLTKPDLVVMDVRLAGGSGLSACRTIRAELPETRVAITTAFPSVDMLVGAIAAGATGVLLKGGRARDLAEGLREIGRGRRVVSPAIVGLALQRARHLRSADPATTPGDAAAGESQVLSLIGAG
jgi:DNA-binding NarL/FixJ family response regulator